MLILKNKTRILGKKSLLSLKASFEQMVSIMGVHFMVLELGPVMVISWLLLFAFPMLLLALTFTF